MLSFKTRLKIYLGLSAGIIVLFGATIALSQDKIDIEQFISPETCGGCHAEIFEQWENSMHNLAHKDPVYSRVSQFLRKGLINEGEIQEAESCVKCHTPVGQLTGFLKSFQMIYQKHLRLQQRGFNAITAILLKL